MRPRILLACAAGLALAICTYAVLAPSGLPRLVRMADERASLEAEVGQHEGKNARLAAETELLRGDLAQGSAGRAALEKVAREELGYVGRDELVVTGLAQVPPVAAAQDAAPAAPHAAEAAVPKQEPTPAAVARPL